MTEQQHTIAYIIDGLAFGGAEKQVAILARSLPAAYRPLVISLSDRLDPFGNDLKARGIDVVALPRRSHNDLRRLWALTRLLKDSNVRIVHGWLDAANAYSYTAGRMLGKPVILSLRNELLLVKGGKGSVLAWMLRHADGVLVNSGAGKEFLETNLRVPPDKITHIRNWVDPSKTSIVREIPEDGTPGTIGFVGRFAKQKRLDLLLSAFSRVLELAPQTRLILMGDGSERDALIDQTRSLRIGDNVEFVDPTPDVQTTMKRFHIFVIPSAFEGLPNAAIEALMMGIPVVSTRVGDVEQLIVDGKTGLFFENETPAAMAQTLVGALANRDLLESALRAAPQTIETNYSIDHALDQLLPVYNKFL